LSGTSVFGAGDFKLTDQLYACAVKDRNVDSRKVFVTGCSAGGVFSIAMAAERSSYVAAAASNSGGEAISSAFQNKHTPPIMTVHGKMGTDVVVIDFSTASATADKAFAAAGASIVIDCDTGGGHCGGAGFAPDIWAFFQAHPFGVTPEPWSAGLPSTINKACMIIK
jgi:dienelactone hydrolase